MSHAPGNPKCKSKNPQDFSKSFEKFKVHIQINLVILNEPRYEKVNNEPDF